MPNAKQYATRSMKWVRLIVIATPNVRAKRATTVGRQAREAEDNLRSFAGLVARRWRSA